MANLDRQMVYFKERKAGNEIKSRPERRPLQEGGVYRFVNGHLELVENPGASKKAETLNIRPGAFYRSRDGRKIQVWVINKDSVDKPIVGMILSEGQWRAWYWNFEGVAKVPYGPSNDIVAEWSET